MHVYGKETVLFLLEAGHLVHLWGFDQRAVLAVCKGAPSVSGPKERNCTWLWQDLQDQLWYMQANIEALPLAFCTKGYARWRQELWWARMSPFLSMMIT